MPSFFEIPLSPTPQRLRATLNGQQYTLTFIYRGTPDGAGGWIMDVGDANNNPLASGLPLVTGADLLAQLQYVGINGGMAIGSDGNGSDVPGFNDLGINSHLYFVQYGGLQQSAVTVPGVRAKVPLLDSQGNQLTDSAGNPLFALG